MDLSDDQIVALLSGIKETVGEIKGKLDATINAHDQRFESLEKTDQKQWVVSACVIPVVTGLHYIASKMGIRI